MTSGFFFSSGTTARALASAAASDLAAADVFELFGVGDGVAFSFADEVWAAANAAQTNRAQKSKGKFLIEQRFCRNWFWYQRDKGFKGFRRLVASTCEKTAD